MTDKKKETAGQQNLTESQQPSVSAEDGLTRAIHSQQAQTSSAQEQKAPPQKAKK